MDNNEKTIARQRIESLFDEGTFVEIGGNVRQRGGENAESVITGYGAVNGVLVFAFSQDVSVLKGSIGEMHARKICTIIEMAQKAEAPVAAMLDSNGARLLEEAEALAAYGKILAAVNDYLGTNALISMVFGTCAGAMSFIPAMSDYSVMLKKAELFLSSPDVVKARYNDASAGTSDAAYANGTVSLVCETEDEAIASVKDFISTLCDVYVTSDDINRLTPEIADYLAAKNYDVKSVIRTIADDGKMTELYAGAAQNIVTAVINLNCMKAGVIANQPAVENGVLTSAAAEKAARFIEFCDCFGIPVISLVNTDGFACDKNENIFAASKLVSAFSNAYVTKIALIMGKAYGSGYVSMCPPNADIVYAYANAEIACLSAETGAVFMLGQKLEQSKTPIEDREALIEEYRKTIASPDSAARSGYIHDIIDVETTRQLLISSLDMMG